MDARHEEQKGQHGEFHHAGMGLEGVSLQRPRISHHLSDKHFFRILSLHYLPAWSFLIFEYERLDPEG